MIVNWIIQKMYQPTLLNWNEWNGVAWPKEDPIKFLDPGPAPGIS